jgi:hypothetical protein
MNFIANDPVTTVHGATPSNPLFIALLGTRREGGER